MADRKTITIKEGTYEQLDEARGNIPWDVFMQTLLTQDGADPGTLRLSKEQYNNLVQDLANVIEKRVSDAVIDHVSKNTQF